MNETRYASLSGSLLARKGGAKPAMRPSAMTHGTMLDDLGWNDMGGQPEPLPEEHVPSSIAALTPAPKPHATPVHAQQQAIAEQFGEAPEPVVEVQPAPATAEAPAPEPQPEAQAAPAPEPAPAPRRDAEVVSLPKRQAASDGRKAAFTLRLDMDRHLKLRLASAVTGRSSQQLVTNALDRFLETLPEVDRLAGQLPARNAKRR